MSLFLNDEVASVVILRITLLGLLIWLLLDSVFGE